MKNMDTKSRIRLISLILFLAMLAVWVVFYFVISSYITDNTEKQMTLAADQIIERLATEFSLAKRLSYSLAQSIDVKSLVSEQNPDKLYPLIEKVEDKLGTEIVTADFMEHIILFGNGGAFYRLAGKLGNKSCLRLSDRLTSIRLPGHLAVDLEGKKYIGYADAVSPNGAVVVLIEEEKILEILRSYDQSGSLLIAIKANNEVVATNTEKVEVFTADKTGQPVIQSRLGITPYEISVTADANYMNTSVVYFTIVALITAAIIAFVLYIYAGILNRRFFLPMVKVIGSIKSLNTATNTETLPYVQSEEFDGLIDIINEMLINLETKNNELLSAELRAKNAEIEQQKSLVFSLKKQINAHFTINTLNTVRLLVERGDLDKARAVAMGLTSLIRYAYEKDELINIWDEFEILQKYIAIMNSRYDSKFSVDFDFDDHLMDYSMPRMLLQPILENAIVHGFKDRDEDCVVSVKAELHEDAISFLISDNGCGMSTEELDALNERLITRSELIQGYENIALQNIKNRLYYYYGSAGQIQIEQRLNGGIQVLISIQSIVKTGGAA